MWAFHLPALLASGATALVLLISVESLAELGRGLGFGGLFAWLEARVVSGGAGGGIDKVAHVLLFFALTGLAHRSLGRLSHRFRRRPLWSGVATTCYGLALELFQGLRPARSSDPLDALADALGALLSVGSIVASSALVSHWQQRRRSPPAS